MLIAAINSLNLGVQAVDLGIASDKPEDLERRIMEVRASHCLTPVID
jgi:hypothetical protein